MIDPRLQQIIDEKKNPISRAILQGLFEGTNFQKYICQRLEDLVCKKRAGLGYDGNAQVWTWDEDEELDEVDVTTIERYRDRAQSQLRRGTYAKRSDNIKTATRKRMNRASGIKKANSRLSHFNNDEYANTQTEGILGALGSAFKGIATQTVAHGLGVGAGTIHNSTKNLSSKPKKVAGPLKTATAAKPVQSNPAQASPHSVANMVLPSHVHSKIGHPDHIAHDQTLTDFINSHNKLISAKEKGDHSAAVLHYRARNHALVRYTQTAPKAHLKHLNGEKVKSMMSVKP